MPKLYFLIGRIQVQKIFLRLIPWSKINSIRFKPIYNITQLISVYIIYFRPVQFWCKLIFFDETIFILIVLDIIYRARSLIKLYKRNLPWCQKKMWHFNYLWCENVDGNLIYYFHIIQKLCEILWVSGGFLLMLHKRKNRMEISAIYCKIRHCCWH